MIQLHRCWSWGAYHISWDDLSLLLLLHRLENFVFPTAHHPVATQAEYMRNIFLTRLSLKKWHSSEEITCDAFSRTLQIHWLQYWSRPRLQKQFTIRENHLHSILQKRYWVVLERLVNYTVVKQLWQELAHGLCSVVVALISPARCHLWRQRLNGNFTGTLAMGWPPSTIDKIFVNTPC